MECEKCETHLSGIRRRILLKRKPFNQVKKSSVSRGWKAWRRPRYVQFNPCISDQRRLSDVTGSAKNTQPIYVWHPPNGLCPPHRQHCSAAKDHGDCQAEHRECDGRRRKLHGRALAALRLGEAELHQGSRCTVLTGEDLLRLMDGRSGNPSSRSSLPTFSGREAGSGPSATLL